MQSRHLGEIKLDIAHSMRGSVQYADASLPVRIELANPARLAESVIEDIDQVLDQLVFLDDLGKQTIVSKLSEAGSPATKFYRAWESRHPFGQASVEAFTTALRPANINIQPDGGLEQPERIVLEYALAGSPVQSTLSVRFLEPTGPELSPAPTSGYS